MALVYLSGPIHGCTDQEDFWLSHCGEDFRFTAQEALERGVVHEVIA